MGKLKIYTASSSPKGSKLKIYTVQPKSEEIKEEERDTSKDIVFTPQESPKFEPKPISQESNTNVKSKRSEKFQPMQWQEPSQFKSTWTPDYTSVVEQQPKVEKGTSSILQFLPLLGLAAFPRAQKYTKDKIKQEVNKSEMLQDILGVLRENGEFRPVKDILNMGMHGIKRKFGVGIKDNKSERSTKMVEASAIPAEKPDTTVINLAQSKASYNINNDTIKFFDGYTLPVSINLNGVKLGSRNRGDRTPIKSAEIIPAYKPIIPYEQGIKDGTFKEKDTSGFFNEFLGYDKDGNIKIGTLDKFGPGDILTQVYYGWITNVPRDNNGNLLFERYSKSRDHRKAPLLDLRGETTDTTKLGKPYRGSLLLSTGNQRTNFNANLFGDVAGGAYILKADNEFRMARGSVNNVIDEIEKMLKNHKGKPIKFYEVDNGSYSRGFRAFDNELSSTQQQAYDSQNWDAGHFFTITPESYPIQVKSNKKTTLKNLREGLHNENNIRNSTSEKYSR